MNTAATQARTVMHIGKFARLTGRSVHTIRWYESQRLIPGVRRDPQGRRLYVVPHIEWLAFLERLRRSGMSIRAIREYANLAKKGEPSVPQCQQLLKVQRKRIEAAIADMNDSLQLINAKIAYYDEWMSTGTQPPPVR